jgi:O-antigen/teichoic acid export membrane protein
MTRAKATAQGYFWNHVGKVLEYLCLFLTTVVLARRLGVADNGIFAMLTSFAQLLIVLSSLSLESSLNRFIPQLEALNLSDGVARLRFLLRRVLLVRGALLAVVVGLAFGIVQVPALPVPGAVLHYFWFLAGYAAVRSFVQLVSMVFVVQLRTLALARIAVAMRVIELATVMALPNAAVTLSTVMLLLTCTGLVQMALSMYVSRTDFWGREQSYGMRPVYAFGAIYWINVILDFFLGRQGDVFFLTTLLPSPVPASMYNVAFATVLVASQGLTLGLGGITLSSFARLAAKDAGALERFYGFLVRIVSVMVVPALVFLLFNASPIVSILFSTSFAGASSLVQGMVLFRVMARLFGASENAEYLLAAGQTFRVVQIGLVGAAVNIVLDLLLVPAYHATGAVVGSGCANLLVNVLGSLSVRRHAGHRVIQWSYWAVLTAASVIAGGASMVIVPGDGWGLVVGRGVVYLALMVLCLFVVKPFPSPDLEWMASTNKSVGRLFSTFVRQRPATIMQMQ